MRTPHPWAHYLGGPGFPSKDRPANATLMLEPGNYILADILNEGKYDGTGHLSKGTYRALTVLPPASPSTAEPMPDIVVRVTDDGFEFSKPLTAGVHVLRVENVGMRYHEFKVFRLLAGRTAADLMAWRPRSASPGPGEWWGGLAGFPPGRYQFTTMEFPAADYVIRSCCEPPQPPALTVMVRER